MQVWCTWWRPYRKQGFFCTLLFWFQRVASKYRIIRIILFNFLKAKVLSRSRSFILNRREFPKFIGIPTTSTHCEGTTHNAYPQRQVTAATCNHNHYASPNFDPDPPSYFRTIVVVTQCMVQFTPESIKKIFEWVLNLFNYENFCIIIIFKWMILKRFCYINFCKFWPHLMSHQFVFTGYF